MAKELWVEKYRPATTAEYVFKDDGQKRQVESWIKDGGIPHLLFSGRQGTGKTTIIGYLQKYLGRKASFAYIAPTHAATAELAFATVKTGNEILPSTLQSSLATSPKTKKSVFSQKIKRRLGYSNPIIVLDEASMIDASDINKLSKVFIITYLAV